ncbi:MAG: hypothetical protein ACE363_06960 [Alphaproteobacteria bacterium]
MRRVWWFVWRIVLVCVLAGLVFLAFRAPSLGQLAVDISAKWACQCRYINDGEPAFCVAEDPLPFGGVEFTFDDVDRSVTADIWDQVSATGRYRRGGCFVD